MNSPRAADWLDQSQNDLAFAEYSLNSGFHSQCCFICQQSGEKALKALAIRRGAKAVYTHSLLRLCQELQINGDVERAAQKLDFYYVSARYPDAFPEGAPHKMFRHEDAIEALGWAKLILKKVSDSW